MIKCHGCKKTKNKEDFYKSSLRKLDYMCKSCKNSRRKLYIKNIRHLINIYYLRQVHNKRKLQVPYTSEEFRKWVMSNKEFKDLYLIWVQSDYKDDQKPSVIRIRSKEGFTFSNLRIVSKHRVREQRSDPRARRVNQYTLDGGYVATYPNAKTASEILGYKTYSGINSTCRGERKSAHGYSWSYA